MEWLDNLVNIVLVVMVFLLLPAFYRVARPHQSPEDRLLGVDLITNLLVGITVVLALVENTNTTIDIGIVIAALSFAGTVSIARYISEGRVL